jgi:class 3 adenylate cyclase/tetratricopeptide (TPR) repeat protein
MGQSVGVVALLFTDLVGSTELLDRLGEEAAEDLRRTHFDILRRAIREAGGEEVKSLGDGLMVAFPGPQEALAAAVAIQRGIESHNRARPERSLAVRVGLHVGEAVREGDDFFGATVVVAKRLCDRAEGGQILASEALAEAAGSRGAYRFSSAGRVRLKGLAKPVPAVAVEWRVGEAVAAPSAPAPEAARRPRMVGRGGELAVLEDELARAAAGEFRCVLLLGEPGVGKTRLSAEFLAGRGASVTALAARAHSYGETTPFGLWAEALERHLRALPPQEVTRLCGPFLDDLTGILRRLPAVGGRVPDRDPPRFRVLKGIAGVLEALTARAPLVVVLDDLQLADDSSWQTLGYLAQDLSAAPLLVVAVARPAELAAHAASAEVLWDIEQQGLLRRLEVGPLDRRAVGELAQAVLQGQPPPPALVEWLDDRSRGNPLFAHGLLQALLDEGADLAAPELRSIPEGLADRVRGRLRELDEASLATLSVLALVGRRVTLEDLVRLSGRPLPGLDAVLEGLVRSRLVLEEERGRELAYEVAHPLIQEAIYRSIGGARRRALHRQVGRVLLAAGRLGEAAPHFARSAEVGEQEAITVLLDAVRQADKRQAYREALALLGSLLELIPAGDERWLDVLDAMAWQSEWILDHRADVNAVIGIRAMRAIEEVLARSPDAARRAAVKSRLASFLTWGTGELEEAERACAEAVELFDEAGDRPRSLLSAVELAWIRGLRGDLGAWEEGARQVAETAEATGEEFVLGQALEAAGWAAFWRGRFEQAETVFRRAIATAREQEKLYRLCWDLSSLAVTLGVEGRFGEAIPLFQEARAVTPAWRETMLLDQETTVRWLAGDYRAAVAATRESLDVQPAPTRRRAIAIAIAAVAAAEMGDLSDAQVFLNRARAAFRDSDWLFYGQYCGYADAILAWHEGRLDDALAGLRAVHSAMVAWQAWPFIAMVLVELAEVAAAVGNPEAAREAAGNLELVARTLDRDFYRGMAALGAGWSRLASAAPDQAAESAEAAVKLFSTVGAQGFLGRALELLGRSTAGRDPTVAGDALARAVAVFEACGAVWRRERAGAALAGFEGG